MQCAQCDGICREVQGLLAQGEQALIHKRWDVADELWVKAAKLAREVESPPRKWYREALIKLAVLHTELRAFGKAGEWYEECMQEMLTAQGARDVRDAEILSKLGELYAAAGSYDKAARVLDAASKAILDVLGHAGGPSSSEEGQRSRVVHVTILSSLGTVHQETSDFGKAEERYREALDMIVEIGGPVQAYISNLNSLATLCLRRCSFEEAEEMLQKAKQVILAEKGPKSRDLVAILNSLAVLHKKTGEYHKLLKVHQDLTTLMSEITGPEHPSNIHCLCNLASLYSEIGHYEEAQGLYDKAWKLVPKTLHLGQPHPMHTIAMLVLNNFASLYVQTGAHDKAVPLYEEARRLCPPNNPDYGLILKCLANSYAQVSDHDQARRVFEEAGKKLHQTGPNDLEHASLLSCFANLHCRTSEYEEAQRKYEHARLLMVEKHRNHPDYAKLLHNLAELHLKKSEPSPSRACSLAEEALEIQYKVLCLTISVLPVPHGLKLVSHWQRNVQLHATAALLLQEGDGSRKDGADSEGLVMRCFMSIVQRKNLTFDSQVRKKESTELAKLRHDYSELVMKGGNFDLFQETEEKIGKMEVELGYEASWTSQEQEPEEFQGQLLQSMPEGSALVEFVKTISLQTHNTKIDASYAAFILHKDNHACASSSSSSACTEAPVLHFISLGSADMIDHLIEDFMQAFVAKPELATQFYPSMDALRAGHSLWGLLLKPVVDRLPGVKHLFLAPDGNLLQVPFVALPVELPEKIAPKCRPRYLLHKDFTISYLTAGRDLLRKWPDPPQAQERVCRIFVKPDFTADAKAGGSTDVRPAPGPGGFRNLPLTLPEGRSVEATLTAFCKGHNMQLKIEFKTGEEATVDALFATSPAPPWVLHIGTHGFYIPEENKAAQCGDSPLVHALCGISEPLVHCGLIFAGAQTWWEGRCGESTPSGIATGLMLQHLDLHGTRLVTLSACKTAPGKIQWNEGALGLGRAMKLAGARSIVLTFWEIEDKSTADLMKKFYQRLVEHPESQGPFHLAVALRDAQRRLCDGPDSATKLFWHPRYWGAFVLQGAVGPIV